MTLVSLRTLLDAAQAGKYAVGAFNCNNMEVVQAIVAAAEEARSPVILQASQGAIKYAGLDYIVSMVKAAAAKATVPMALHLDHGTDFNTIMACIRAGFTSVMFDGSKYEKEENIARTKEIVKIAHAVGVSVEGEIGKIGGVEDDIAVDERDAMLTPVPDAIEFYEATGVDALAMSFGTAHGPYKLPPKLDLDRIAAVHQKTGAPLVMHGGSGVPEEDMRKGIELGIRKVNIDTELRQAFLAEVRRQLAERPDELDPRKIFAPAREVLKEHIKEKMRLFGCAGKA
ncbi:class II fructose-1,6-bisphosphate aldolase [Symbiobacterium thermophilum]|uniref:Fructose-bisphosphate aldolase n=1 Tax=Symbiobacterium thermophilum (strain DSM 24528 / JCM 14929 / IAM 14863 / T) TaxID=292459 RepID=Q67KX8_SYMTH|nr:class II fructose-1,6-bisphosphate aldolase [Symbiobacterium thermophilum]BAD41668.1 fructose-bisphosphate aldolase [Symbiobacterium thermophilum IAM 14863]